VPPLSYVLPLRWEADDGLDELTSYLDALVRVVPDVVVADGSPPEVFAAHAARWRPLGITHVAPHPEAACRNGKVAGVHTGLRLAAHPRVVIADDDVRYDAAGLAAVAALLDRHDLVRPQNHFDPMPWHARWDTARSLLNRAVGADYPGTFGVRRDTFRAMGGYDGDVLFENLELIRTVQAYGGTVASAPGVYVRRLPPTSGRFWSQRVRQAYDDLAQPARLALFLAVVPAGALVARRRPAALLAAAGAMVGLAEVGRRRAGGAHVFPAGSSLLAPAWVLERAICSWLAVGLRLSRGGVGYAGHRLRVAAHPRRHIAARLTRSGRSGGPEADRLVGAVAERLDR
jgi:hypothetical protein